MTTPLRRVYGQATVAPSATSWSTTILGTNGTSAFAPVLAITNMPAYLANNEPFASANQMMPATFAGVQIANNSVTQPGVYTFTTTPSEYERIFSAQCNRVHAFINGKLIGFDQSDEEQRDDVVESIAGVINLMGEPAFGTAMMEARVKQDEDPKVLECLLLGIAAANHVETEPSRVGFLHHFAHSSNYAAKRVAVRALGRMSSKGAKKALEDIGRTAEQPELRRLATALAE